MGAETDLSAPPPEPMRSSEPEILGHDDRSWKSDMMSALGESVSFGRFLSEPLEWGKWSAFAHNRYLEEAAGQSRPGSVAQKKAFFEAHYARKRKSEADAGADEDEDEDVVEEDAGCDLDLDAADGGCVEEAADGGCVEEAAAWSAAGSSCMTDEPAAGEETCGVDSGAPSCGGIVDAAPVEASEELKAVTEGVGSSCWLDGTDERSHEEDEMQVAEVRKGMQLHDSDMVVAVDAVEKQPLQESSIVNQDVTDSVKRRKLPMSSLLQKPAKFSSPPSGKKGLSSSAKRWSPMLSAKENSSPSPSTDSNKKAATSILQKRSTLDTLHMSMNLTRCETGNATSRSRNLGSTIAARISQLESASRPAKDTHPKVNQFRPAKKGFCKGMPEIASSTSQLEEQRSSHASVTRVKEKLFGSASPLLHRKANITKEKVGKANNEAELKELRQSFCFKVRPLPNFYWRNKEPKDSSHQSAQEITNLHLLNDACNPQRMSRGASKDKQICCFPIRRLC